MKMLKFLLPLLFVVYLSTPISADVLKEFNYNASSEVKTLVEKNSIELVDFRYVKKAVGDGTRDGATALILDARPLKKYQISHIPSAKYLLDTKFDSLHKEVLKGISKNKEIIVYCGGFKCTKSVNVAVKLKDLGYKNVKVYQAGMPQWKKREYVEIDIEAAYLLFEKKEALFVDARPYKKFMQASILGALSIPDMDVEKFRGWFPRDKMTKIVLFCGGYACAKSHNEANYLVKRGYKNVKVLASGFPSWKKLNYPTTNSSPSSIVKKETKKAQMGNLKLGEDEGTVNGEWFYKNYQTLDNIAIIDVRGEKAYQKGHIKGATLMHTEKMKVEEIIKALPKDKSVVFYCGTGTRAMETWDRLKEAGFKNLDKTFYFDANIKCKDSECSIKVNEPLGL